MDIIGAPGLPVSADGTKLSRNIAPPMTIEAAPPMEAPPVVEVSATSSGRSGAYGGYSEGDLGGTAEDGGVKYREEATSRSFPIQRGLMSGSPAAEAAQSSHGSILGDQGWDANEGCWSIRMRPRTAPTCGFPAEAERLSLESFLTRR